jgi:hypothetical protein
MNIININLKIITLPKLDEQDRNRNDQVIHSWERYRLARMGVNYHGKFNFMYDIAHNLPNFRPLWVKVNPYSCVYQSWDLSKGDVGFVYKR